VDGYRCLSVQYPYPSKIRSQANRAKKLTLNVLSANLKKQSKRPAKQFPHVIRIFQPESVFGWHRQLIKRKWTHAHKNKVGRTPTADEVKELVIQLALEKDDWGYGKISGELEKFGIELSETAVGNILKAEGIEPAPVRAGSIGWKTLMRHYREQLLATDFFTLVIQSNWRKSFFSKLIISKG
jgi:hypothetical protein